MWLCFIDGGMQDDNESNRSLIVRKKKKKKKNERSDVCMMSVCVFPTGFCCGVLLHLLLLLLVCVRDSFRFCHCCRRHCFLASPFSFLLPLARFLLFFALFASYIFALLHMGIWKTRKRICFCFCTSGAPNRRR